MYVSLLNMITAVNVEYVLSCLNFVSVCSLHTKTNSYFYSFFVLFAKED